MKNPYVILNVHPKATDKQIKEAFKKMSKKTHPDKGGSSDAFIEVKKAYEILSDPIKRKMYDEHGTVEDKKIEQGIYNDVYQAFFGVIIANPNAYNTDIITTIIDAIDINIKESYVKITGLDNQIFNINKYRGKIKLKPEHANQDNIFEALIDAKIISLEKEKEFWGSFPEKLGKLKEFIQQYESKVDNPPIRPFTTNYTRLA